MEDLQRLCDQLIAIDRLDEILDDEGNMQPSESAIIEKYGAWRDGPSGKFFWRLAQKQTLLDLAAKYEAELTQRFPPSPGSLD